MENRLGNYCVVRRQWDRDAMAIWFCQRRMDQTYAVAKPLQLEFMQADTTGFFQLPEPTLILPGPAMKEFFEQLGQELEYQGERFLEARSTIKAQDANLADLRKYLDKTFGLLAQAPTSSEKRNGGAE